MKLERKGGWTIVAGIHESSVVDVVGHDPTTGEYVLFMVEDRPWGSDPDQPSQLREKINTYVGFVLDGSLAQHAPEAAGRPVRLQLDCVDEPTGAIAVLVEHADAKAADLGLRLVVNVRRNPEESSLRWKASANWRSAGSLDQVSDADTRS